jgi:pimeloyl-ACP methyl ester carboxylesterase
MTLAATGTLRNANGTVKATLTPFASALLVSADVDARDVDLAQFVPSLPATALTVALVARPAGNGFAGTVTARNASAGPLDAGRIPVAALSSAFAWDGSVLALTDAKAELPGGGRAAGDVRVPTQGGAIALQLGLREPRRLAGVLALSTYLPLAATLAHEKSAANGGLPIFMAHGEYDPVIPLHLADNSRRFLEREGYPVEWHVYPMPHSVCAPEIAAIAGWLEALGR